MAYRNKTYIAFDGDNDIHFYLTMLMWKQNDNTNFDFFNAHDINTASDYSTEETIKRKLRERMMNSKVFVLLVGDKTKYLYKFVKWEIELAIKLNLPIIVVNLPKLPGHEGSRRVDYDRCPNIVKDTLAIHIPFKAKIMQHALENWIDSHYKYTKAGEKGSYYYVDEVYTSLGL